MLTFFRRGGAGQIVLGAVVFAIILVFVMEFRPGRTGGGGVSRECAVKVLDSCVDRKEYFAAFGLAVPRGLTNKKVKAMGLRKTLMEGFVERELLLKEADRLGISVSDEALDVELMHGRARVSLPMQQISFLSYSLGFTEDMVRLLPVRTAQTDEFDLKIYERVVRNTTNRSPKEFRDMQRREMTAQRMRDLVRSRVRVSEVEAYSLWERDRSKAVARTVSLKRDWFAKWAVDASDTAVRDWAAKNEKVVDEAWKQAAPSWKAECPLVSEIMVAVEEDSGDVTKTEKRQKIDAALAKVKKGEAFELAAKSASEGMTAIYGGELGCLSEGYGPGATELIEAAKGMKPGQVSEVVETKRGFHVIKLHARVPEVELEKTGKLVIARRLAVNALATGLAKEFGDKLIEQVGAGAKLDEATTALSLEYAKRTAKKPAGPALPGAKKDDELPALLDALRPRVEISAPFSVAGSPIEDADRSEAPAAKVLELKKADDVVPKPVKTSSGFAVLQLKEKTLAKREDFEKDRLEIMRSLRAVKATDAVARYVAALRSKVKDKITLDSRLLEESEDTSGDG